MEQLKVGDKIRITNMFRNFVVEIERVTKTQAISKPYNDAGSRYRFHIGYTNKEYLRVIGMGKWNTTNYKLII